MEIENYAELCPLPHPPSHDHQSFSWHFFSAEIIKIKGETASAFVMTEPGTSQSSGAWCQMVVWTLTPTPNPTFSNFLVTFCGASSGGRSGSTKAVAVRASCRHLRLIYQCWWYEMVITEAAITFCPQVLVWFVNIQRHIQKIINVTQESNSFWQLKSAEGMNGTEVRIDITIFLTSCHRETLPFLRFREIRFWVVFFYWEWAEF